MLTENARQIGHNLPRGKVGLTARCMSPKHSSDEGNDRECPDSDEDAPAVPKTGFKGPTTILAKLPLSQNVDVT